MSAARSAFRCRRTITRILGTPGDPGRVAFFMNATQALNTAMAGVLSSGDAVVLSDYDHNAVLRPADSLARHRKVEVRRLSGSPEGGVDPEEVRRLVDGARLLVINQASNVLGTVLPVRELATLAHDAGALVLVDVAQSAGHLALDLAADGADLVAFTGHKGLLGPQGTGGLWVREGIEVDPLLCGGTGGNSEDRRMPAAMPDRLEAGTHNAPGIEGLLAGCTYLLEEGIDTIHAREIALKIRLHEGLSSIRGVRVLSPPAPEGAALVTFVTDRMDPATLTDRLDREYGIQARPGLHCAPEAHRLLGSLETGAVRLSLGWASDDADVDAALHAIHALAGSPVVPAAG